MHTGNSQYCNTLEYIKDQTTRVDCSETLYMCSVQFLFLYAQGMYMVTVWKSGLLSAITYKVNRVCYINFVHVFLHPKAVEQLEY